MMNIKNHYLFFILLFTFSFLRVEAQVETNSSAEIEVLPSDGMVDLSTTELQSLIQLLMKTKRKRQQLIAAQNPGIYRYYAPNTVDAQNQITDQNRLAAMEKLLLEMNERLLQLSDTNYVVSTIAKSQSPANNSRILYQQDSLQTALQKELRAMKADIQALSINPPPAGQKAIAIERDTQLQNGKANPYLLYAQDMIALRKAIDSLDNRLAAMVQKSEYVALEKQLMRIEQKMKTPVLQPASNNTLTETTSSAQNEDMASKKYMDAQFTEMRRLIGELKMNSNSNTATPIVVTPPAGASDDKKWLAQERKIQELNRQIAELKRHQNLNSGQDLVRDTIVINEPEIEPSTGESMLLALQQRQYEALSRQIAKLQSSIAANPKTPVETNTSANSETEALKAEIAALRQMIAQMEPPSHTVKEKVIIETSAPDTSYNWLKSAITGKEKSQLFYDNNALAIKDEHKARLQQTIGLLNQHGKLDVLIVGFTSQKGSPAYNQALSQNRAENAKRYLVEQGIHPGRIFTEYHGIDYNTSDPAQARRVDLVIMIRR